MRELIVYYSYTGHTAGYAAALARERGADLWEVKGQRRSGTVKAYTAGCIAAMGMKRWDIEAPDQDFEAYEKFTVMGPVWAGYPAPPLIAAMDLLPGGKPVEVLLVSASGKSRAEDKVRALLEAKGNAPVELRDVKG